MNKIVGSLCIAALVAGEIAIVAPAFAQPADKMARPAPGRPGDGFNGGNRPRPPVQPPRPVRPGDGFNGGNRPRPPISPPVRPPISPPVAVRPPIRPPVIQPPRPRPPRPPVVVRPPYPGNGYRPPHGGWYRPPPRPPGGWGGGYYPPSQYYYDRGPSAGEVIAGVVVAGGLLALLSSANRSSSAGNGQSYVPPQGNDAQPAAINVDLMTLPSAARPVASTCLTEAARQIGATGGREISIAALDDVEKGNGGYRLRMTLNGTYPDETRRIPMYCRATPTRIIELTFG
ncbi:hypothetical protein [Sandarakinorhabdus sp. DWP1-3-1]|uniref:hypothetical protein n=1 Tax=Sandarakinorhabdus sp. DWP1-3-1 TaxID=2804627 RepID=UPI003CF09B2E